MKDVLGEASISMTSPGSYWTWPWPEPRDSDHLVGKRDGPREDCSLFHGPNGLLQMQDESASPVYIMPANL